MAKETTTAGKADTQSFLNWGQERTEAAMALQKSF